MKVLVVYAHPYKKSLNHAILEAFLEGLKEGAHEGDLIDLNQDEFNPVLNEGSLALYSKGETTDSKVLNYQNRIKNAQYVVFIFPIWWANIPAVLKGFIDKVFLPLFAFKKGKRFPIPLLKCLKGAAVFSTMSSPKIFTNLWLRNPVKQSFVKGTLKFSGIKKVKNFNLSMVDRLNDKRAKKWLGKVRKFAKNLN